MKKSVQKVIRHAISPVPSTLGAAFSGGGDAVVPNKTTQTGIGISIEIQLHSRALQPSNTNSRQFPSTISLMAPDPSPAWPAPRGSIDMPALNGFLSSVGSAAGPDLILSPGKELYHYTSLPGLMGIIENGDLWLTHTLYLNDEEEMAHGDHVAAEAIAAALANSAADPKKSAYLNQLNALLGRPSNEGVYICCFCQRDNLLSQWRGYGANGAGVSLQFDSAGFAQWTGADCPHGLMRFWKVFYKTETQRRIVDAAINYSWSPYVDSLLCAQRAADAIQFFVPTFKNPDFEEEAEMASHLHPQSAMPNSAALPRA